MHPLHRFGAAIAAICITITTPAAAQEDDDRARIHFEAGRSYFDEGDYERALTEWQRSYELSGRSQLLLNIATTLERLVRWGDAAETLERYLDEAQDVPDREVIERRIQNLRQRAAERATEPPPIEPPPDGGDSPPDDAAPPPPALPVPSEPADTGGGIPTVSLVSYIAGGVGLATFAIFGSLALSEESDVADGCGRTRTCGDEELDSIDTKALIADIGLAVAVVGAAVGTVLWLTADGGAVESRAAVSPWIGPGSAGAAARVSF